MLTNMFVLAMVAKVEVLMLLLLLLLLEPSIQIGRSNHYCIVLGPRHCRRHSRRTFVRLWVVQCFFRAAANDGKRLGGGGALMLWWVDVGFLRGTDFCFLSIWTTACCCNDQQHLTATGYGAVVHKPNPQLEIFREPRR